MSEHLVDNCRDLKTIVSPFPAELAGRDGPQLVVNQGYEAVERVAAAPLPLVQELGDVGRIERLVHT